MPMSMPTSPARHVRFIGRVGALAVALGIGTALTSGYGVAIASTDETDASSNSADATPRGTTSSQSPEPTGDFEGDNAQTGAGGDGASDADKPRAIDDTADTEDNQDTADADFTPYAGSTEDPGSAEDPERVDSATEPIDVQDNSPADTEEPENLTRGHGQAITNANGMPNSTTGFAPPRHTPPVAPGRESSSLSPTRATVTPLRTQRSLTLASIEGQSVAMTTPMSASVAASIPQSAVTTAVQSTPLASEASLVSSVVTGLLAWVGFGPSLTDAPVTPTAPLALFGFVTEIRRLNQNTSFSRRPISVASTTTSQYQGDDFKTHVDGAVTGTDPDDDAVRLSVAEAQTIAVTEGPQLTDTVAPSVTAGPLRGVTRNPPLVFTVSFSEPVTGFTIADVDFTGTSANGTLIAGVSPGDGTPGTNYNVTVNGMTTNGFVKITVPAGKVHDAAGNPNTASNTASIDWQGGANTNLSTVVATPPSQPNPATAAPLVFDVKFSAPVSGFTGADIDFAGSTVGGTLIAGVSPAPGGTPGADYKVVVNGMISNGIVRFTVPFGVAKDAAGDPNKASNTATITWAGGAPIDTFAPTAVVRPMNGGVTRNPPLVFGVTFSEPVTGFTSSDVLFTGSTAGGNLIAGVSVLRPGESYQVIVNGMTTNGAVRISVPAGAAFDAVGNPSVASNTGLIIWGGNTGGDA